MLNAPYEPWPLTEQTAIVLGLPLAAVTPTVQLIANRTEWLWFQVKGLVLYRWQRRAGSNISCQP